MLENNYNGTLWEEWWLDATGRSGQLSKIKTRSDAQTESALAPAQIPEILQVHKVISNGGKLLLCGNGGSAADAQHLAAEMLATTYGVNFDPDASWDEKRELWEIDNRIVKTESIIQTAKVDREGYWCTTVSAAVLIL